MSHDLYYISTSTRIMIMVNVNVYFTLLSFPLLCFTFFSFPSPVFLQLALSTQCI